MGFLRKITVHLLLYVFGGMKNFALLDLPSQTLERVNRTFMSTTLGCTS
jgi:hypothetical protein